MLTKKNSSLDICQTRARDARRAAGREQPSHGGHLPARVRQSPALPGAVPVQRVAVGPDPELLRLQASIPKPKRSSYRHVGRKTPPGVAKQRVAAGQLPGDGRGRDGAGHEEHRVSGGRRKQDHLHDSAAESRNVQVYDFRDAETEAEGQVEAAAARHALD